MVNRLAEFAETRPPQGAWWPPGRSSTPEEIQRQLNSYFQQATEWVKRHPEIALSSAVATGVVLGWFLKRR